MTMPATLAGEMEKKGLRDSLWIALLFAQNQGLADIETQLTKLLVEVDRLVRR